MGDRRAAVYVTIYFPATHSAKAVIGNVVGTAGDLVNEGGRKGFQVVGEPQIPLPNLIHQIVCMASYGVVTTYGRVIAVDKGRGILWLEQVSALEAELT